MMNAEPFSNTLMGCDFCPYRGWVSEYKLWREGDYEGYDIPPYEKVVCSTKPFIAEDFR